MKNKIERKYLITKTQCEKLLSVSEPYECHVIFQGYFWADDPNKEFRVKFETLEAENILVLPSLTIKDKKSTEIFNRIELDVPISFQSALKLFEDCKSFIWKKRYIIYKNENRLEINYFSDKLIIVKIEFNSNESFENFTPSFEYEKEVTFDKQYYGKNLASSSMSKEWVEKKLNYFKQHN